MSSRRLVSVTIPTMNSERTLDLCLRSIVEQTYDKLEIVVVDGYSRDRSREIASNYGAKVLLCDGNLLESRFMGTLGSSGDYILMLDSDQILERTAIERSVFLMEERGYDMLVLEEESWPGSNGLISNLYKALRKTINQRIDDRTSLRPGSGFFLPRMFERKLLLKAFDMIPYGLIKSVTHYDHDIIYYEAWRLSDRIGILRKAIYHVEPDFKKLLLGNLRYGASMRVFSRNNYYEKLIRLGESRLLLGGPPGALLLSLIIKVIQRVGYYAYPVSGRLRSI